MIIHFVSQNDNSLAQIKEQPQMEIKGDSKNINWYQMPKGHLRTSTPIVELKQQLLTGLEQIWVCSIYKMADKAFLSPSLNQTIGSSTIERVITIVRLT